MNLKNEYNGGLTREQFLFHEMRITASLLVNGYDKETALKKIKDENLFQFPTEKLVNNIANVLFRRFDALDNAGLQYQLANASHDVAKQINLYAMMQYNRLVRDFMITVIGEKFQTRSLEFSQTDLNLFFFRLREQEDSVAEWSDSTVNKIKQVLKKCLIECGYLDTPRSNVLNNVFLYPELEQGLRENNDFAAFAAFNFFE